MTFPCSLWTSQCLSHCQYHYHYFLKSYRNVMNYLHQNLLPFSPWHFYFSPCKSAAHVRLHVGWLLFFCEASFQVLEFPILRRCSCSHQDFVLGRDDNLFSFLLIPYSYPWGSRMSLLCFSKPREARAPPQANYLLSKSMTKIAAQAVINYKFPVVGNF